MTLLKSLLMIAQLYSKEFEGQQEVGISFYKKAKKVLLENQNEKQLLELIQIYSQISQLFKQLNHPLKSIKYNNKAIDLIQQQLIKPNIAQQQKQQILIQLSTLYTSQGTLYAQLKDYTCSLDSFVKSLQMHQQIHGQNSPHLIIPMINLGSAYLKVQNFSESVKLIEQAIQLKNTHRLVQKPQQVIVDKLKLCEGYKGLKEYQKCIDLYDDLIKYTQYTLPDKIEQIASYYDNQARLYYLMNTEQSQSNENQTLRYYAFDKISTALELFERSQLDKFSDIYIKALIFKGFVSDKNGPERVEAQQVKTQVINLLKEIFTNSNLFEEYSDIISLEIFENEETLNQLIQVCGPFKNEELFRQSRAKEMWRMLVLEQNQLIEQSPNKIFSSNSKSNNSTQNQTKDNSKSLNVNDLSYEENNQNVD